MAPPKKPASRRVRTQTRDIGLVSIAPAAKAPPPPHPATGKKLLKQTVDAWTSFWESELASLVKPSDTPALVRLFRMYDTRERFERLVLAQPMVPGSMGQPKVNPAAAEVASLDTRITALEDRFGLSPAARLKLGITFGAAAKSLEDLNRGFDDDPAEEEGRYQDPRLKVLDAKAT